MKPFFLKELTKPNIREDGYVDWRLLQKWARKQIGRPFDSVLSDLKRLQAVKPGRLNWLYDGVGLKLHTYKDGHRYCSSINKEIEEGNFYNRDGIFSSYKRVPLEETDGPRWIEFQYGYGITAHWQEGDRSVHVYRWYQTTPSIAMSFLDVKLPLYMSSNFISRYHKGTDGAACFSLLVPETYIEVVASKDPNDLESIMLNKFAREGSWQVCGVAKLGDYKANGYFSNACRYKQITKEKFNNSYFELMKAKGTEQYD